MNSEELKSLQAPLKEKYREQPQSAIITLKAQGKIGEGVSCKVETGKALVAAGLHPATRAVHRKVQGKSFKSNPGTKRAEAARQDRTHRGHQH